MAAQRAELSVGQASLCTFDVSAVPKPHKLYLRVYPRSMFVTFSSNWSGFDEESSWRGSRSIRRKAQPLAYRERPDRGSLPHGADSRAQTIVARFSAS
jgi:hypothetical protein